MYNQSNYIALFLFSGTIFVILKERCKNTSLLSYPISGIATSINLPFNSSLLLSSSFPITRQ